MRTAIATRLNRPIGHDLMTRKLLLLLSISALAFAATTSLAQNDPPVRAGWAERMVFPNLELSLAAKLDTGARTSSLHAARIHEIEVNGKPWIRFTLTLPNHKTTTVERPLHRTVAIRRAGTTLETRPVVLLTACVAGVKRQAEFNLTSRAGMTYPVLIGRTFLQDDILVDSSKKNLKAGSCTSAD